MRGAGLLKGKQPLADIVQPGKQAHAYQHGDVGLELFPQAGQHRKSKGLGNAVGHQIAHGDIEYEPHHLPEGFFPILERKILIEKITEDAGEDVICPRGKPVGASRPVIKPQHNGHPHQGVDDSYQNKFQQLAVNKRGNFHQWKRPFQIPAGRGCMSFDYTPSSGGKQAARAFPRLRQKKWRISDGFLCSVSCAGGLGVV